MREDGYYWVLLPGRSELSVARWQGITNTWSEDGWDWFDGDEVGVLSENRLMPPETWSGCLHQRQFRRGNQCKACGTWFPLGPDRP